MLYGPDGKQFEEPDAAVVAAGDVPGPEPPSKGRGECLSRDESRPSTTAGDVGISLGPPDMERSSLAFPQSQNQGMRASASFVIEEGDESLDRADMPVGPLWLQASGSNQMSEGYPVGDSPKHGGGSPLGGSARGSLLRGGGRGLSSMNSLMSLRSPAISEMFAGRICHRIFSNLRIVYRDLQL